jgi:Domain of unknown function (DUF6484)
MPTRIAKAQVVPMARQARVDGARVGRLVRFERGKVWVALDDAPGAVPARAAAGLDDAALAEAAGERREVVLLFEDGDPSRPIVLDVLRPLPGTKEVALAEPLPQGDRVAHVDGERVVIEGRDEIVLRCGKATLTLRRDGKVVLRGVNVVSQAEQVQKVRGGKVQIN